MTIKEARPTEYKGILYRSKSEAMFARWLELRASSWVREVSCSGPLFSGGFNRCQAGFEYEPEWLEIDGWKPDFMEWYVANNSCNKRQYPTMVYSVIEYKPSRPTDAYIQTFATRCKKLIIELEAERQQEFLYRASWEIYYGSVFNLDRGRIEFMSGDIIWNNQDWLEEYEEAIKATRFDLATVEGSEV
jgi:hypothetical protein